MKATFYDPFFHGLHTTRKLLLIGSASQTFAALPFSMIIFLFYKSNPHRTNQQGQKIECIQTAAYAQQSSSNHSDYSFDSISQELKLYCGGAKTEAIMISSILIGYLVGAILCAYLSQYNNKRRNTLVLLLLGCIISVSGIFGGIFAHQSQTIALMLGVWSMGSKLMGSFSNCLPAIFYPPNLGRTAAKIQTAAWPLYSIATPILYGLIGQWRIFLPIAVGLPLIVLIYYLWANQKQLGQYDVEDAEDLLPEVGESLTHNLNHSYEVEVVTNHRKNNSKKLIDNPEAEEAHTENKVVSFNQIVGSPYLNDILMYFLVYAGTFVAQLSSTLSMNTLSGNIYLYASAVAVAEFILALLSSSLTRSFNYKNTVLALFLFMGVSSLLFSHMPGVLQDFFVLAYRPLGYFTLVLISIYTQEIVPQRYLPLCLLIRSIYSPAVLCLLPYLKYYLEQAGGSVFTFSGVYQLVVVVTLYSMKESLRKISKA